MINSYILFLLFQIVRIQCLATIGVYCLTYNIVEAIYWFMLEVSVDIWNYFRNYLFLKSNIMVINLLIRHP